MSKVTSHTSDTVAEHQARITRSRVVVLGVVLPILIAGAGLLLVLSWLATLPNPVATHWSPSGVDGVGDARLIMFIPVAFALLFSVLCLSAVKAFPGQSGRPTLNQKIIASASPAFSLFLTTGIVGSLASQRGLTDAAFAPDPSLWLLIGAVGGVVLGAVVWLVLPRADRSKPSAVHVPALVHGADERIFWTGVASMSTKALAIIAVAITVVVVSAVIAAIAGAELAVLLLCVALLLAASFCTMVRFRVSAGPSGLSVVSAAGWPAIRVPLSEVDSVRLIEVNPVGDFGGWGLRWAAGKRTGIIMQAGPAIEVNRRSHRTLVVPVDDARTAVAVLQTALAQRESA